MSRELYVDGRLYLVQDGDQLLEPHPVDGRLMENCQGPGADRVFGIQLNFQRDMGSSVEVRES